MSDAKKTKFNLGGIKITNKNFSFYKPELPINI